MIDSELKSSSTIGEFDLIQRYFCGLTSQHGVELGIGDDAAVISLEELSLGRLVVSMDGLVGDVHFPLHSSGYDIARRALCVNLSDMAAMGATPRWFTLSLNLPEHLAVDDWLADFSKGLGEIANPHNCALIGGDVSRGNLALTITIIGEVPADQALTRKGASPGDHIYVTGTLGDGAAALQLVSGASGDLVDRRLYEHFYAPKPRIEEGLILRGIASACIDISDGLLSDLSHICAKSEVGADINLSCLPVHSGLKTNYSNCFLEWALSGGDDYELCFTVPSERVAQIDSLVQQGRIDATFIGEIIAGKDIALISEAGRKLLDKRVGKYRGYNHFV